MGGRESGREREGGSKGEGGRERGREGEMEGGAAPSPPAESSGHCVAAIPFLFEFTVVVVSRGIRITQLSLLLFFSPPSKKAV